MKKLIAVTIVTLILSTMLGAESWLQPKLNFTTEMFWGSNYFYEPVDNYPDSTVVERISVGGVGFGWVLVEGMFDTYMQPPFGNGSSSKFFAPYQIDYGNRIGITHWGVTLGWEHWCYHPVQTYGDDYTERYGGNSSVYIGFDLAEMIGPMIRPVNWTILIPELQFKFKYMYENQAVLLNPIDSSYTYYEYENQMILDGRVGFTLYEYVYFNVDFMAAGIQQAYVQIDYQFNVGVSFGGVRLGYFYSDYVLSDELDMPLGNWYGKTQGIILEIDLARIQAWSRRNR